MRNGRNNGRDKRKIADTVGVKKIKRNKEYNYETFCIEVKVSIQDFRSGFNSGGTYNWILAPIGVIPIEELPEGVGLIEVDLDKFNWEQKKHISFLHGLTETKPPKRKRLSNKVGLDSLENICKKLTIQDVYKSLWIQPKKEAKK